MIAHVEPAVSAAVAVNGNGKKRNRDVKPLARVGREGAQNTPFDQGARATQQRLACQRTGR